MVVMILAIGRVLVCLFEIQRYGSRVDVLAMYRSRAVGRTERKERDMDDEERTQGIQTYCRVRMDYGSFLGHHRRAPQRCGHIPKVNLDGEA
jgi:hypothetical protein